MSASNTTNVSLTGDRVITIRAGESCPDGWEIVDVVSEHTEYPGANGDGSGDGGPVTAYTVIIRLKPYIPPPYIPPYVPGPYVPLPVPLPWSPYYEPFRVGDPPPWERPIITCGTVVLGIITGEA